MKIIVRSFSVGHYLPVVVNGKAVQTINARSNDWPKHDPDPANCTGKGRAICVEQGEHSWFNHSQDHMSSNNIPEHLARQVLDWDWKRG